MGSPADTTLWLDREEASPWLGGLNIHDFDNDAVRAAHSLGIDDVSPYNGDHRDAEISGDTHSRDASH